MRIVELEPCNNVCEGMVEVEEMECVWDDMIEHDFLDEWRKKLKIDDDEILEIL